MNRRRNIVFLLIDDLRYDGMGFLKPVLKTPNIDRLAREGVYFKNAFVTSSLCSPSRATILTGLSRRNHRIMDNYVGSEEGLTYFSQYLQQAGYQCGFFGKWHFGAATDAPRPGFDRWVSFMAQGNYSPTEYMSEAEIAAGKVHQINVDGEHVSQKGYMTDELNDYAMDWLENRRDKSKPFFLYLSHKAVHAMAKPPARYADQYKDVEFEIPASAADTVENNKGKPIWVRNQRNSWHGVDFIYHTGQKINDYMRDYYRTLSPVDEGLGRLLAWLEKAALSQNTAVIFTSDNGYMEGEHGLIDKRNAYEESLRVPLLFYAPGLVEPGRVVTNSVTNLDLAPTFLDLASVQIPPQFEGRSVVKLATGEIAPEAWNEDVIYEYYWEAGFPMTPTTFAIRSRDFKYIQYQGVWDIEELYDLKNDSAEMHNLIDDDRYSDVKIDLRRRLYMGLTDREGRHVIPYTRRTNAGVVFRNIDGAKTAAFPDSWLRRPDAGDLVEGLLPDSPRKLQMKKAGKLPRLWTAPRTPGRSD